MSTIIKGFSAKLIQSLCLRGRLAHPSRGERRSTSVAQDSSRSSSTKVIPPCLNLWHKRLVLISTFRKYSVWKSPIQAKGDSDMVLVMGISWFGWEKPPSRRVLPQSRVIRGRVTLKNVWLIFCISSTSSFLSAKSPHFCNLISSLDLIRVSLEKLAPNYRHFNN